MVRLRSIQLTKLTILRFALVLSGGPKGVSFLHEIHLSLLFLEFDMARHSQARNRLAYDTCEPRQLLAGDVSVFLHNDTLVIRGDNANNQIQINANDAGDVTVSGVDGTTINRQSGPFTIDTANGQLPGGISANLGRGSDQVFIEDITVNGRAVIFGGAGDDSVGLFQTSVTDDVFVQTFSGDDSISLDEVQVGDRLTIHALRGDDVIGLDEVDVAGFTLITSGQGNDDLGLRNATHRKSAFISTGLGEDFVGADQLTVNGNTGLLTGFGSDDVYLNDSQFNGRTYAFGGFGSNDNLEVDGTTEFSRNPRVRNFEGNDVAGGKLQLNDVYTDLIQDGARLGTIVELAQLTPQLSTLVGALQATGLDAALSADGPFTVFAPLNSAFDEISEVVGGLTTEQLTNVLLFHVTSGEVFANELVTLTSVSTLLNQSFSVDASGAQVILNGEVTLAATDIRAKNGVIHLLNEVLIPAS